MRCLIPRHVGGPTERQRKLTDVESAEMRQLCDAARLFDGGYVGADLTASDRIFETLRVSEGGTAVLERKKR